ncbi:hypothetical protein BKA64DRAFT_711602 [Cadophora sp. MPI-SDFR-AT-0126]|nr:hypothetical protein BKA64DRAFT_711602 [Leotiomycetes sp. MPI-SDFR-AT-0126]
MAIGWISLSSRWDLSSVQAALNVIISFVGAVGIWSFSRYWWQRGAKKIIDGNSDVPLSNLVTLASLGEGWDVAAGLRRRVFAPEGWHLLFQLVVVILATLATMFSGPIAKGSLRTSITVQQKKLEVLQATKGDGILSNMLMANTLWNDTIDSLNQAQFPRDELLDYLPPSTVPWTYIATEWNPTWRMACSLTTDKILYNVSGSGNGTFYQPLDAFPAFRDSYDQSWLNQSNFRVETNFNEMTYPGGDPKVFQHTTFFVLLQSDPQIDDRMYANNETLQLSMSVLHARGFQALEHNDMTESGTEVWKPFGPVTNASYSRADCNITRKSAVLDENSIPWIWTNDTDAIIQSYMSYFDYDLEVQVSKRQYVPTISGEDLLRFYQAYMITASTLFALPSQRKLSVLVNTVQLSSAFLAVVILLAVLIAWQATRYRFFLRKYKAELGVPDGKVDWMIHWAKVASNDADVNDRKKAKDRDYLRTAYFGIVNIDEESLNAMPKRPQIARVYTNRTSISGMSESRGRNSVFAKRLRSKSKQHRSSEAKGDKEEGEQDLQRDGNSEDSRNQQKVSISFADPWTKLCVSDNSKADDEEKSQARSSITRQTSEEASRPPCNGVVSSTEISLQMKAPEADTAKSTYGQIEEIAVEKT